MKLKKSLQKGGDVCEVSCTRETECHNRRSGAFELPVRSTSGTLPTGGGDPKRAIIREIMG
jgi:hypothetical protein